ncbi:hypothetical protein KGM_212502 [Danaus plexippus plexippus]|uniref:Uncharacterized protein n=1 Tax=Danaus plexippus plexippus TaxID=278856 RepID=A0A212F3U2_DANPL|nr:hypothetical protein KGM_212502 [Danaus plexippus plexippus]
MSFIRILPVIALFLIQYTIQSELERDDDLAMIVVKPPALRTNDYVTVDAVYPTKEALRRPRVKSRHRNKSRNNNKSRNKKGPRPSRPSTKPHDLSPPNLDVIPDIVNAFSKSDSAEEDPVVVLLFSNSVFDNISGGHINFDGNTKVNIDQKDQTSRRLK